MLHEFLATNRDEIIARCLAKVALKRPPRPIEADLALGVPMFLDQLIDSLRLDRLAGSEMKRSAFLNGADLLRHGVTIAQVVHSYGDVCQAVTELAVEKREPITPEEFHVFNQCIDEAIAESVTEYQNSRDAERTTEGTQRQTENFGTFAHELRNLLNATTLSYYALRTGNVGIAGSTGEMHGRSLAGMRELIDRTLAEIRLSAGMAKHVRVSLPEFVEDMEIYARLEAEARGLELTVVPVEPGLAVAVDRQILTSVVTNLLQNALKFTRPHGRVVLQVHATHENVYIEVRDECGGLPEGRAEDLFRPFEQRSADRSGLGLGLTIVRDGVHESGGTVHVTNLPGTGCVFTVELPRLTADVPVPTPA
jgi:signal transduction histidine kinase